MMKKQPIEKEKKRRIHMNVIFPQCERSMPKRKGNTKK